MRALKLEPVVAPLLQVELLPFDPAVGDNAAALAFTSANGVRAWVEGGGRTDRPALAVGRGTAEAAKAAGFADVRSAEGDGAALAAMISRDRPVGTVLHPAAEEPAFELAASLGAAGVPAFSVPVYRTVETGVAAPPADVALLHSPRAARAYARLADGPAALCLSEAVAAPLRAAGRRVAGVADCPSEEALLKLLSA